MKQTLLIFFLILFCGRLLAAPGGDFKLVKTSNGINLYERWVMHNGSKVRELKVSFEVTGVGFSDVVTLLKDAGKGGRWNVKSSQYKIAVTRDANVWLNYIRYALPWPMEDQDCSLKFFYTPTGGSGAQTIYFESVQHQVYPRLKNVTRLEGTSGRWVLDPLGGQEARITYQILTNKSASVPRWVSDPIVYDNILNTMYRFKSLLQQH